MSCVWNEKKIERKVKSEEDRESDTEEKERTKG